MVQVAKPFSQSVHWTHNSPSQGTCASKIYILYQIIFVMHSMQSCKLHVCVFENSIKEMSGYFIFIFWIFCNNVLPPFFNWVWCFRADFKFLRIIFITNDFLSYLHEKFSASVILKTPPKAKPKHTFCLVIGSNRRQAPHRRRKDDLGITSACWGLQLGEGGLSPFFLFIGYLLAQHPSSAFISSNFHSVETQIRNLFRGLPSLLFYYVFPVGVCLLIRLDIRVC